MSRAPFLAQMAEDLGIDLETSVLSAKRERVWFDLGNFTLNLLINHRGLGAPGGHIAEFFGKEASGKSLLAYKALAAAQKMGGIAVLIDTEGAFDAEFATRLGVDIDNLMYIPPTKIRTISGKKDMNSPQTLDDVALVIEYVLKKTTEMYDTPPAGVIVWDSISMTNSFADLGLKLDTKKGTTGLHNKAERSVADSGRIAKELRQILTRVAPRVHSSNFALIAINHVFEQIEKPGQHLAEKTTARGGKAPKYHSRLRLEFSKSEGKKDKIFAVEGDANSQVIGEKLHVYIKKNSVGPPYGRATLDFMFGLEGELELSYYSGYFEYLISLGKLPLKGTWYSFTRSNGKVVKVQGKKIDKLLKLAPELKEGPNATVPT